MKKIYRYLMFLLLAMISACSDEIVSDAPDGSGEVTLHLGVGIPTRGDVATRSLGETLEDPSSASIIFLAFDENHLLTNVYKGQYEGMDGTKVKYSVTLKTTSEKRIFHVLVNHNVDINTIQYGLESDVLNSLAVGNGRDVYWTRVELPDGVSDDTTEFNDMKLIRNYAKITLKCNATTLTNVQWGLMGIPTMGSVAPYIKDQTFADYFVGGSDDTEGSYQSNYSDLYNQGYIGNVPRSGSSGSFYSLASTDDVDSIKWVSIDDPLYTYENEGSSESSLWQKTVILIRGNYDGADEYSYYRISLVDAKRNYEVLNILRNLIYEITIGNVEDKGLASAAEAYAMPASNNVSGSTETKNYQSVNIGDAVLRVEYMKKYILYKQKFTMMARYVPDVNDYDYSTGIYTADNTKLTLTTSEPYTGTTAPAWCGDDAEKYSINSLVGYEDGVQNNYRQYTFQSNAPKGGEDAVSTTVRVTVDGVPTLYRDVEFILRERYKMQNMELYKDIDVKSSDSDRCFTLTVEIPSAMPKEIFPLDFTFECYPACVYPNVNKSIMQVSGTDESIFTDLTDDDKTSSFHYHRSVTWDAYNNVLSYDGKGGFQEKNKGWKRISFFFKINDVNFPSGEELRVGVFCNDFSPNPKADLDKTTASILESTYIFKNADGEYSLTEKKE